ncbi:MAG: 4-hydroxythreonine-4-phosphate dehydrogenase PdxA [Bacteroidales bacterium]|nr:4-hydroxythreonine-4-phosphate dehydrogenase PdxA [Bacteroidales bacterium]
MEQIKVGITQGDINGISYEVIIKTLMDNRINELCVPIVYGSAKVAAYHRKALDIQNFSLNIIGDADKANLKKSNVINTLDDNIRVELGKSSPEAGKAALNSLEHAVNDLKEGKIDVLVTAPINKDNIQSEEFDFPGHTEYLTQQFGQDNETLMLMVSELMKVGVVTGHLPLKQVPEMLTQDLILRKLRVMDQTLLQDFKIRKPRIAVFGLNPHPSDGGLMGDEESNIIIPAIKRAKEEDIMAFGPYSADGFFGSSNIKKFDGILAMYHDQGLAPFKAISFDEGVNFTAGLNIVRTSPDHGTAYELAGKNEASPTSFRNALFLALDIFRNRQEYQELASNPLQPQNKGEE